MVKQSREMSPWTEGKELKKVINGEPYTNMHRSIYALAHYVEEHDETFGSADHVALFTG